MPITATPKIWMNGDLVDWDKAQIHILTHSLHYGMGVFEGIRAYETSQGPAVFRLTEHIERFHNSAKILGMEIPYSVDELIEATKATVASTGLDSCYVRPIAYFGYGEMGLNTMPCVVDVSIACWPWRPSGSCRVAMRVRPTGATTPPSVRSSPRTGPASSS